MNSTAPATSVILFARKPSDVNTTIVLQWFLSQLFQEIKLGTIKNGEWVVIRISNASRSDELLLPKVKKPKKAPTILSSSSASINSNKDTSTPTNNDIFSIDSTTTTKSVSTQNESKTNQQINTIIVPNTEILFTFASFSISLVIELFLSSTYVSGSPTIGTKIKHEFSLIIHEICKSLRNQYYVSRVYISVMGFCAEYNLSYLLFRGELSHSTDPDLFLHSLHLRMLAAEKEIREFTRQTTNTKSFPSFHGFLKSAVKGHELLPPETFTKSIIILSDTVDVDTQKCQTYLENRSIPFYVCSVHGSRQAVPILNSFAHSKYELCALVESSRGRYIERQSISTTNNTTSTATSAAGKLDNFIGADFFTYSFLTETPRNRHTLAWQLRNHASVLALNDTPLQSYVLSDSTVEHIIASRLAEGFRITTIKFSDSTSNQYMSHSSIHSSNNIDSISMSRQPTGRQTSRVSSQEKTIIIRFQKLVSGLSLLLYETSFRWGKLASNQATNTARQNLSHNNSFALFRERSSPRVTSGDSASSRLTWLSGSISVDIKCSAVPSTVASVSRSLNTSITLAKRISEVDNSVVSLLGLPFFPGCQTESSTPSSRDPRKSHLRNLERNISTFDRLTLQDCHHKQYYYIYKPAQQLGTQGAGTGLGLGVGMNTSTPTTDTTTIPKLSKDQSLFVKESNRNILLNNLKESFPLFGIELQLVLDGSKILIILSNVNSVIQFCYLLHVYENCNCFLTVSLQYLNVYSDDSQSFMTSKLFQTIETTLLHLSIQHVRIRCDLTPSAILQHQEINLPIFHKNDYSLVLNQLQSRHILISDKSKESLPLQFLLSDLIRIKESLGWQCILNLSYDTHISLIMVAVVSNCPTGQRQEALLQFHLKAQFTQEGVSLEYQYRFPHYVDLSNQITSSSYITATSTAISANKDVELVSASTLAVAHNLTDYLKLSKDLDEDTFYLYSVCFRLRHAVFTPKKVNMNEQAFKLDDWNMISRFSVGKEMKLYTFHDRESLLNYDVIRMLFVSALRNISNLSTMRVDGGSTGESFDVLVWAQGSSLILMKFPNICEEEEVYVSTNTSTNDNNNNGNNGNYESTDARFFDEDETEAALATEKKVYFRVSVRLIELPCSKLNPDFPLFKKTNVSMLSTKQVRDETHFKWQKTFELQRRSQGSVEHSFAKMKSAIEELHEICILERLIVGLKSISVGNSVGTSNNHLPTIDTTNIPNKADRSLNQNVPDTAIQERDIEYILRRCVSSEYEVDISAMFRRIASSLEGRGGMNRKPAVFNMLYGAFMTTVSKQITDTLGGLIFSDLMSSTKDFSVDLFGALSYETLISQLSNHQFIRFSLMYRSDENVPFKTSSLPSTSRGLIDTLITLAVQLLTSSRLNRSSFEVVLQLNVMSMRLPTYPSSSWIICNDGSSNQNCTTTTTPTYTTSCSLFLSNVCKSVRQFVAAESLLHFLQSSQALVADDLILVQQSLTEHDDVLTHEFNLEFFVPVSKYVRGQVAPPQTDSVIVSLLASQLKILQPSCNQKSDVIYLRQWQIVEPILPLDSIPTEHSTSPPSDQPITAVNSTTTTNTIPTNNTAIKTIPLWILMTLVSNTSDPTDTFSVAITHNNLSSTSQPTMSMKLSVSLKILGNDLESSFSQEYMLTQCIDTLQKGWVRVNQAILLQNLLETQSSSPLLIAPPIKPAILTPTTSTASLTTTSDLAVASQTNPRAPKSRPPIPTLSTLVRKPITPTTPASTSATPVPVGSKVNKIGSIEKIPPRMSKALNDGSAETLTDGIASIDSKENNETETTKTSNTLQTDNASLPFKLNTNKLIEPGCFACQKQGEVVCNVYSCVTLNQESIVRSLEAVALSQIAVQNNERYFVSRVSICRTLLSL